MSLAGAVVVDLGADDGGAGDSAAGALCGTVRRPRKFVLAVAGAGVCTLETFVPINGSPGVLADGVPATEGRVLEVVPGSVSRGACWIWLANRREPARA